LNKIEISIVDYGLGNLLSVQRGFEHCGYRATITSDPELILNSKKVVLPGVGAFPRAIELLKERNLFSVVKQVGLSGIPLLAICLGMQLLFDKSSEFGETPGLGLIPGNVDEIPNYDLSGNVIKVPHIGWNSLLPTNSELSWNGTLLHDTEPGQSVYFVHSYKVNLIDPENQISHTVHGGYNIPAVVVKENIYGCQFHPEKSGDVGLKILRRFVST
jgi:glutamine amidotransferase